MLNEEGEIECFTKNIDEKLGLFSKDGVWITDNKVEMAQICPKFTSVNHSFNVMTVPNRYQNKCESTSFGKSQMILSGKRPEINLSIEEAKKLFAIYSEQGEKNQFKTFE